MKRLSRRVFLSDSILAAATLSALGPAMTGTKARAQGRPLGPNETLGVMVVGCGGRGTGSHIPEFVEDPRTKILYVCDPDPAQAAHAADMVEEAQQFCLRNMKVRTIIDPVTGKRTDRHSG